MEILKERELTDKYGNLVLTDEVLSKTKLILLYFGSVASDGSSELLQKLIDIYETCKAGQLELEIIYISSDPDANTMRNYFQTHGDWYAVPFEDVLADELRFAYMVRQLPHVAAILPNGHIVSRNALQEIMDYGKNVLVKWF